jgi:copper chaperone CopZ
MYIFKVEGMNCMSCVHNINDALKEFDENLLAVADLKNKTVSIETSHPQEKIGQLIDEAGYQVTEMKAL